MVKIKSHDQVQVQGVEKYLALHETVARGMKNWVKEFSPTYGIGEAPVQTCLIRAMVDHWHLWFLLLLFFPNFARPINLPWSKLENFSCSKAPPLLTCLILQKKVLSLELLLFPYGPVVKSKYFGGVYVGAHKVIINPLGKKGTGGGKIGCGVTECSWVSNIRSGCKLETGCENLGPVWCFSSSLCGSGKVERHIEKGRRDSRR